MNFSHLFVVGMIFLGSCCYPLVKKPKQTIDVSLCPRLKSVAKADALGIVEQVKSVNISDASAPYNASIVKSETGYILFYRQDTLTEPREKKKLMKYDSHVFAVDLSVNFDVQGSSCCVAVPDSHAEDPRAVMGRDRIYLSYTALCDQDCQRRSIHLAELDCTTLAVLNRYDLDLNISPVEKNWTPFLVGEPKASLYMRYYVNNSQFFSVDDVLQATVNCESFANGSFNSLKDWERKWGKVRGGTPAVLVDGEYLSFFHSSFNEKGKMWYVMGAYTFEKDPPFKITKISSEPILFDGIYSTMAKNTAKKGLRSVFPCGIIYENNKQGAGSIHVSIGENDCAVKIITFNKEKLMNSLRPILPELQVSNE